MTILANIVFILFVLLAIPTVILIWWCVFHIGHPIERYLKDKTAHGLYLILVVIILFAVWEILVFA